jgi:hypothetical protein
MAQQTATDDDAQLADELADLATVGSARAHHDEIKVRFNCDGVTESFNAEMLSQGYAVASTRQGGDGCMRATYKKITDF